MSGIVLGHNLASITRWKKQQTEIRRHRILTWKTLIGKNHESPQTLNQITNSKRNTIRTFKVPTLSSSSPKQTDVELQLTHTLSHSLVIEAMTNYNLSTTILIMT